MHTDEPRELSAEVYQALCNERWQTNCARIVVMRDVERGAFYVNWQCWETFRTIWPSDRFPIDAFQTVAQQCATHGYHLVERGPLTKQQKAFKKLQGLCHHAQSALWSGRITRLDLATGSEFQRVSELYAWDHASIPVKTSPGQAPEVRYFLVPVNSSAFRIQMARSEPFMLRVLADPRMAMVMS